MSISPAAKLAILNSLMAENILTADQIKDLLLIADLIVYGGPKPEVLCVHEFVIYQGLTETYEYCKICDKRKS